jgi:thioredoxin
VDFTATWCGPCKRLSPILEELAKEYKGKIVIYKVDVDKCEDLARAFNISSIPALLFIPMEGQPEMIVGLRSKEAYKSDIETKLLKK